MKFLASLLLVWSASALAQSVDIKDVAAESEETTIEIRKGKKSEADKKTEALWEIVEGDADIEGDEANLTKEAKANWKVACENWKKEFRAENKDNKIIAVNCGTTQCQGTGATTVCSSKATYKIKTKLN